MSADGERFYDEPDADQLAAENERLRAELAEARAAASAARGAAQSARVSSAVVSPEAAALRERMLASDDRDEFFRLNVQREEAEREAARRSSVRPEPTPEERLKALERARTGDEATFWSALREIGAADDTDGYRPADPDRWAQQW